MNNTVKKFIEFIGGSENIGKIFPINVWDKHLDEYNTVKEVFITFNLWDNSKAIGLQKLLKEEIKGLDLDYSIFKDGFFDIRWTAKAEFYGSLLEFFQEEFNKRRRRSSIRTVTLAKFKNSCIYRGHSSRYRKHVKAFDQLGSLYDPALHCNCTMSDLKKIGLVKCAAHSNLKWLNENEGDLIRVFVIERNKDFAEWDEIPEVKQVRFIFELERSQEEKEQFEKCRALVKELKEETKWMNQDGQEHLKEYLEFFEYCANLKELNQILSNLIARAKKLGAQEKEQEARECKEWREYTEKVQEAKEQTEQPQTATEEDEDEITEVKSYSIELGGEESEAPEKDEFGDVVTEIVEKPEQTDEVTQVMEWSLLTAKALEVSKYCGKFLTWDIPERLTEILTTFQEWTNRIQAITEVIEELEKLAEIADMLKDFNKWDLLASYMEVFKSLKCHSTRLAHLEHLKTIAKDWEK